MNELFHEITHVLKSIFFDRKALLSKLLTIIIVILILGSAFEDQFAIDLEKVKVGTLNKDEGQLGKEMINLMKENDDIKKWIALSPVKSFEEGQRRSGNTDVKEEDKLGAMLQVPSDFSKKYQDDKPVDLKLYTGKTSQLDTIVIKSVFDTFVNMVNISTILAEDFHQAPQEKFELTNAVEDMSLTSKTKPNAMSYYTVAMLMMVLLFGTEYGVRGVSETYLGTLGERIKTTPANSLIMFFGKMIGLCLASFLQGVFLMLFAHFVFDVEWGENILMLLLIVFAMSAAATSIGSLICMITRNEAQANSVVSLVVIGGTFLAGGFIKMDLGELKYLSPNFYGQTAMFNTMYQGDMERSVLYVVILFGMALLLGLISVVLAGRKRA